MTDQRAIGMTGLAVTTALGRGAEPQLAAALAGVPGFGPVRRFDVSLRRVQVAATLAEVGSLADELAEAVSQACAEAGLSADERAGTPLLLAVHGQPGAARLATELAERAGLAGAERIYTAACVSASSAVADAAALIRHGLADRVVVAAGYLVEPEQFALFDAGKALSGDGAVRPFSRHRQGLLLGDGVAAVVLEATDSRSTGLRLLGWGRAGDGYHPCQPAPGGQGLARAVRAALQRAGIDGEQLGYVNANATGTQLSDAAEAAGLRLALGEVAGRLPISSTKSVHGHTLEASGLVELVITALSLRAGKLAINAGYLGPDPDCPLDVITEAPRPVGSPYAISLNSAFGGANTALVVGLR
ncbi:MAG TPA: beta-ketoacyl synthase N-terminal-like domain-containing protein [Jatrophihabitans sp.]|nr:beta-ketoacyl synthase N-terminal-like domain-containing protein [Jatrophihabitans sp.]